jgi:hypothetical protein
MVVSSTDDICNFFHQVRGFIFFSKNQLLTNFGCRLGEFFNDFINKSRVFSWVKIKEMRVKFLAKAKDFSLDLVHIIIEEFHQLTQSLNSSVREPWSLSLVPYYGSLADHGFDPLQTWPQTST